GVTKEEFTVRELRAPVYDGPTGDADVPGLYSVTAFGHTQSADPKDASKTYEGFWVEFDAAGDDDAILFQGSKAGGDYADQTDTGGEVPAFTAPVVGSLGDGNDIVTTGAGDDVIQAGTGNDQVTLLQGDDEAHGDTGVDILLGGEGSDLLRGDGDGDVIDGGPGGDDLDGGTGADRVDGGRSIVLNDGTIVAADLEDEISGGTGDDLIHGGEGDDDIWGDVRNDDTDLETGVEPEAVDDTPAINDVIHGEEGDDTIYAGAGNDEVHGDTPETSDAADAASCGADADDTVYGQAGEDLIDGGAGCDGLHGGDAGDELLGGVGDDDLFGDAGEDTAWGGDGQDDIYGGTEDDELHGEAGADDVVGNAGADELHGGDDDDRLAGDDATIASGGGFAPAIEPDDDDCAAGCGDELFGGDGDDHLFGQGDVDTIHGGSGGDQLHGNGAGDLLHGERGADTVRGNAGADVIEGGPDDDLLFGNSGADTIHGQAGDDRMVGGSDEADPLAGATTDERDELYGGAGTDVLLGDNGAIGDVTDVATIVPLHEQAAGDFGGDLLDGGADRDRLHGQDGTDELYGGAGEDQLFGGLGGDELEGQDGADVMLGDRGQVTPAAAADLAGRWPSGSLVTAGAPQWTVVLVAPDAGARDHLQGGSADDRGYGGAGDDLVEGGAGDDHLEGNGGRDELYGMSTTYETDPGQAMSVLLEGDEDDLIGGSSSVHPGLLSPAGAADEGELVMLGNAEQDVMVGDNADIDGVVSSGDPTAWAVDDVTLGRLREVTLHDRTRLGADLEAVSGGDRMLGNGGADRMSGQGGKDVVKGNAGDDFVHGNQDDDLLEGNDGEDDLVGGTSLLTAATDDGDRGDPDGTDVLYGGAGADVLLGDNGVLTRIIDPAASYTYVTTQLGIDSQRGVTLFDLDVLDGDRFGGDLLSGGAGVDVEFGQDGDDILSGGPADDYQEGNGGSDGLFGDRLPADATLLADVAARGLTLPPLDAGVGTCGAPVVGIGPASCLSPEPSLSGGAAADAQDDQLGGSSRPGHRDAGDGIWGDGAADFQLGDNGELLRTIAGTAYLTYVEYNATTVVRQANRFDVGGPGSTHGDDLLHGNAGDDYQWAQDGGDELHGDADNDDMYGELGADLMFGGTGEDAMIGDRGVIADRKVVEGDEVAQASADTAGPAFLQILPLRPGDLDRRVDLLDDGDGDMDGDGERVEAPGLTVGGDDRMFGGPDHDVVHGAFGDDLMNGEDGGDWLFGADGADVIWGGRGDADPANAADPGTPDGYIYGSFIDVIFGGHGSGGDRVEAADIMDWRPRPEDPALWHEMTATDDDDANVPATVDDNQHHHGVDWIYGGYDRDVLQGDIGQNGPEEFGDRLIDWVGNFNMYTRCNASYGDDGDIRQRSPAIEEWLETLGFVTGVGASLADVRDPSSSAYRQLAVVYKTDTRDNNGQAFPSTPGHFDDPSCQP
ncbi:MAG: hypothetical protein KY461_10305, partial [Actinobacteria bacterium]|nr:hypothetical protein [Actinomycetota bacterium]